MRVIARKTLRQFWENLRYADAEQPLKSWFKEASEGDWAKPADVKTLCRHASIIGNSRVVFNVGGNKYRLVVKINYRYRVVYIRFIGTHAQYDKINAKEV